jgi:hypothetical protein
MSEPNTPESRRRWNPESREDRASLRRELKARYGELYETIGDALDSADPMHVVYTGNPNEYEDVVWQVLGQIEAQAMTVVQISVEAWRRIIEEALAPFFGEEPDQDRLAAAANLIESGLSGGQRGK